MNEVTVFNNEEFGEIRTVVIDGDVWFISNDVARALEYKDLYSAARHNVDDEDKRLCPVSSAGGTQDTVLINESGLYSLIFSSKLDKAKKFKRRIYSKSREFDTRADCSQCPCRCKQHHTRTE